MAEGELLRVQRGDEWIYGDRLKAEIVENSCFNEEENWHYISIKPKKTSTGSFEVNADRSQTTKFLKNVQRNIEGYISYYNMIRCH